MPHPLGVHLTRLLHHLAVHAGEHLEDVLHAPELLHLLHRAQEVLQVHPFLAHLLLEPFGLDGVERLLCLLHQREHVALLEDPPRHAVGMELLERVTLLTHADVLDRFLGRTVDRERRATSRVAVHLREDHTRDAQGVVEALRDAHGVLAGHAVGHEQDLVGLHRVLHAAQLVHHRLIDLEAPGGVDDDHPVALLSCQFHTGPHDPHDIGRRAVRIHRHIELLPERLELVDGGGTIHVRCHEPHRAPLALELPRELRARRGLPRSLQPDHHDDGRRQGRHLEPFAPLAEHHGELVVDDLHQLLGGRDGLELGDADGPTFDALEELASELETDVGFEEDPAHFAQAVLDVGFGEHATAAELRESGFEFLGEFSEHRALEHRHLGPRDQGSRGPKMSHSGRPGRPSRCPGGRSSS